MKVFGLIGILIVLIYNTNRNIGFSLPDNICDTDTNIRSIKKYIEKDGKKQLIKTIDYDAFGNVIYEKDSIENKINETIYKFNDCNQCLSKILYSNNKSSGSKYYYKYNQAGIIEEEIFENDNTYIRLKYNYDLSNKLTKTEKFDKQDLSIELSEYEYNQYGKITKIRICNCLTKENFTKVFEYNRKGNLIKKNDIRYIDESDFFLYKYDKNGNQIEEKWFFPNQSFLWQKQIRKYDNQNRLVAQKLYANENREKNHSFTHYTNTRYTYDNLNLIAEESYTTDWNLVNRAYLKRIFKYNNLNKISEENVIEYSGLNLDTLKYKYIYEYYFN